MVGRPVLPPLRAGSLLTCGARVVNPSSSFRNSSLVRIGQALKIPNGLDVVWTADDRAPFRSVVGYILPTIGDQLAKLPALICCDFARAPALSRPNPRHEPKTRGHADPHQRPVKSAVHPVLHGKTHLAKRPPSGRSCVGVGHNTSARARSRHADRLRKVGLSHQAATVRLLSGGRQMMSATA